MRRTAGECQGDADGDDGDDDSDDDGDDDDDDADDDGDGNDRSYGGTVTVDGDGAIPATNFLFDSPTFWRFNLNTTTGGEQNRPRLPCRCVREHDSNVSAPVITSQG